MCCEKSCSKSRRNTRLSYQICSKLQFKIYRNFLCYKQHNLLDNLPLVQKMNKVNSTSVVIVDFGKMSQCGKSLFWQSSNSSKKLLCFSYGMQLSKMIMSFIFEIKLHMFCHSWEVSVLELFH